MRVYRKLAPAINSLVEGELLIAKDVASGGIKQYCVFTSLDEFIKEDQQRMKTGHRRHFYEVILENNKQRLYFDIDIPSSISKEKCEEFIMLFVSFLGKKLSTTDIGIYISHSSERYSYHIVIRDKYAISNVDCKIQCISLINEYSLIHNSSLSGYIDRSMYKRSQLFRMIGSSKIDKNNVKMPHPSMSIKDTISLYRDSIISYYV